MPLGSDTIDPVSVTYDETAILPGSNVLVTIAPSTGTTLGGTITYMIETNIDGMGWIHEMQTTETTALIPVPDSAVSWNVRVYAKDDAGFTSDTYVYGNGSETAAEVIYSAGFSIYPGDKSFGYLGNSALGQILVTTKENANYTVTITLDEAHVISATQAPGIYQIVLPEETWEALEGGVEHTLVITAVSGGESLTRTFTFYKFEYDDTTIRGVFAGIKQAICVKRGIRKAIRAYDFPLEILKISDNADAIEAYIDVTIEYLEGAKLMATASSGNVYSCDLDESGVTRILVQEPSEFIVQARYEDVYSDNASVSITEEGQIEDAKLAFIKVSVETLPGAVVTAELNGMSYSYEADEEGSALVVLPTKGTWSLVASFLDYEATGNVTVTKYANYTLDSPLYPVSTTLNDNDWGTISKVSAAGLAQSLWEVGDAKAVVLNGTVGSLTLSNQTYYVYILGFDHNGATNSIDFGTFKTALTGGNDIALVESIYGSMYDETDTSIHFQVNHWSVYNYGGWKGCDLRYDVLGSTNVAPSGYRSELTTSRTGYDASDECVSNPVPTTLMAALPVDLRAVMKPMVVYTDNVGGDTVLSESVTSSIDYLPCLSEYEVTGATTYSNAYEQNYQSQYTYYLNGNSAVKLTSDDLTSCYWALRSPYKEYSDVMVCIQSNGTSRGTTPIEYLGLAPIFRV